MFIQNSKVFIQGNALENVICEMAANLSRPQYVKSSSEEYIYDCKLSQHYFKYGLPPVWCEAIPDSKVYGDKMGPTWGRQDPGGTPVGPTNHAVWDYLNHYWVFVN